MAVTITENQCFFERNFKNEENKEKTKQSLRVGSDGLHGVDHAADNGPGGRHL